MATVKISGLPDCIKVPSYREVETTVTVQYSLSAGELSAVANGCHGEPEIVVFVGGPSAPKTVEVGRATVTVGTGTRTVTVKWKPNTSWMQGVKDVTFFAKLRVPWRHEVWGQIECDEKDIASDTRTTKVAYGVSDCGGVTPPNEGCTGENPNRSARIINKNYSDGVDIRISGVRTDCNESTGEYYTTVFFKVTVDPKKVPALKQYIKKAPQYINPCAQMWSGTYDAIVANVKAFFGTDSGGAEYSISPQGVVCCNGDTKVPCDRSHLREVTIWRPASKFELAPNIPPRIIVTKPGNYTVRLDLIINGTPVTVATATVSVTEGPSPRPSSVKDALMQELKKWYKNTLGLQGFDWSYDVTSTVAKVKPGVSTAILAGKYEILNYQYAGTTRPARRPVADIVSGWEQGYEQALFYIGADKYPNVDKHGWYWVWVPCELGINSVPKPPSRKLNLGILAVIGGALWALTKRGR